MQRTTAHIACTFNFARARPGGGSSNGSSSNGSPNGSPKAAGGDSAARRGAEWAMERAELEEALLSLSTEATQVGR
jgi:hypothetical protein